MVNFKKAFLIILLIPFTEILKYIASKNTILVENIYSKGIFQIISKSLSNITGLFPFSVMEILIIVIVIYFIYRVVSVVKAKRGRQRKEEKIKLFKSAVVFISLAYFLFFALWSLNNYRLDVKDVFKLDNQNNVSIDNIVELYEEVIIKTNNLRDNIDEDKNGVATAKSISYIINNVQKSYKDLSNVFPMFKGKYGRVKPLTFSFFQTLAGYTGIYSPFTAEPNINKQVPIYTIPHTACHEVAHQRGFAQEDAANYVGFLACKYSKDEFFQYSGYLFILNYLRNTIYSYSDELGREYDKKLNEGVKRDLNYKRSFWSKKVNYFFSDFSDLINNLYLKSNNQEEGMFNYDKVVELIIADYNKHGTI